MRQVRGEGATLLMRYSNFVDAMFLSVGHGKNDPVIRHSRYFRHKKTNKVGFFELGCDVKSVTG